VDVASGAVVATGEVSQELELVRLAASVLA
jgi:hypothetical protein